MIGTTVGQYRILARIGEGGMGAVYRGEDTMLQRQVAIKVLRPELAKQKVLVDRFRTEAVALARLNHPNIAAVYGLLQEKGQLYMVLEYVDGETLEAIVARRGPIPWNRAVQVAKDTLAALDHAHRMGVVHRDLKPSNLMLSRSGQLKVMDFGIARLAGTSRHTEFGRIVGTPLYMSPEQLRGEDVDGRSDVYSLGVVLYELLTGREAFQADSDYALLMAQLNQMPVPASRYVPDLPVELETVLTRSLEKPKSERWTSASAFRRALTGIVPEQITEEQPLGVIPAGPTRVVDQPSLAAPAAQVPATRLAALPSVPATRLADLLDDSPQRVVEPAPSGSGTRLRRGLGLGAGALTVVAIAVLAARPRPRVVEPPAPPPVAVPAPTPAPPPVVPASTAKPAVPVASNFGQVVGERPKQNANAPAPGYGQVVGADEPARRGDKGRIATAEPGPVAVAVAPEPAPPPPAPEEPVDLSGASEAFHAGLREIARALETKNLGAVETSFGGEEATRTALLTLLREFPVLIEKESLAGSSPATGGRAIAEYTATLRWRSSFGNTRKVPVRIVATFGRDGASWRLRSWRFAGRPDLD